MTAQAETLPSSSVTRSDKADLSRERILRAASRLFREQGYAAVSLRAIAAAAGMKAGSVYYHFSSKQSIVIAILDAGIVAVDQAVRSAVEQLPADAGAGGLIRAGVRAHLQALFDFSDYTSANVRIYAQVPPVVRQANLPMRRRYEALWDRILVDCDRAGGLREAVDLKAFRLLLIGSLNATLEWFDSRHGRLEDLAERYADMLLNGLLRPPRA